MFRTLAHLDVFEAYSKPCQISKMMRHTQNIQNTFRTAGTFKSLWNMKDYQAYFERWHSQNSLFKHFQGYLRIFMDIDAYAVTLTGT